jgi:nucleotide-binding universal stress UspA family protein
VTPDFGHGLVPLDGSKVSEQILEPATELGSLMHSDLVLLEITEPVLPVALDPVYYGRDEFVAPSIGQQKREAEHYLEGLAVKLRKRALTVETCAIVHTHPAAAILEQAHSHGANWIAMQTHGRRGLARLLLGSVADKIIRCTPIPVLISPPRIKPIGEPCNVSHDEEQYPAVCAVGS